MQSFPVTFSRNVVTLTILLVVPLAVAAGIVIPLLIYPDVPDWFPLVASVVVVGVSLGSVLFLYKRYAAVPAKAELDDNGINIRILRASPFYKSRYSGTWDGISNISSNIDAQHNKRFYLITFRDSGKTVQLMPEEFAVEDVETDFGEILMSYVARFNDTHTAQPDTQIRQKGFYDTWWALAITVFCYALSIIVLIGFFVDRERMPFWRVVQVLTFSAIWLATYHANKRKQAK